METVKMSSSLKNQVAIVTGSTRGIGFAIAKKLLERGAQVVVCGSRPENLEKALEELSSFNQEGMIIPFCVDVSKPDQVEDLVRSTMEQKKRIDILVNNAGIVRDKLLLRMEEEDWDKVIEVNLKSVFLFTKMVLKHMIKAKYGRIVNISSVVALGGNAGQSNYSASKAGMIGFSRSVAKEVARKNITVNAVAPGFIETKMTESFSEKTLQKILAAIPQGRFGKAEDVADLVAFLTSLEASYITGELIHIDGGMLI